MAPSVHSRNRSLRIVGAFTALIAMQGMAAAQSMPPTPAGGQGLTPIGVGGNPDARRLVVEPGIRSRVDFSNNPDLQPPETAESGTRLEVMPYVTATLNSPRGVGGVFYGLRGIAREGGINSRDEVRHDLRGWGDIRLTDDNFRILARANVFDVPTSPFGASSFDPSTQTSNRTQYRDFEVSPYAFGRFDGEGRWNARYSLRYIDPGSAFEASTTNQASGFARSDLERRRIGWSVNGLAYDVRFQGGFDYEGGSFDLLGWSRVVPTLRVGAGAGYARNSILFDESGRDSGWGPTLSAEWVPDARTSLFAIWSDRYYGPAAELRASHRTGIWTFGLTGSKGLRPGTASGLYGLNASTLFNAGAPVGQPAGTTTNQVAQTLTDRNLLSPAGQSFGSGVINSPLAFVEALVASAGWTVARNTVLGTLFVNNRRTAITSATLVREDIDQWGGSLQWTYRLDSRNAVNTSARFTLSDNNINGARANLGALWLSWDYNLTSRSITSVGARVQRQRAEGDAVEFDEAALFAVIDYRF